MANFLAPILNDQQENANGAPLSGGTAEVYLAGSSTPATTYSDQAGAVPNTWPVVFNTLGVNNQGAVWLVGGFAYKFIIKDSTGVVQRTIDNVVGINDSTNTLDQWIPFPTAPTYVSAASFTVAGDQRQIFQINRRIKTQNTGGTIYGTVTSSTYVAPNTTVTVRNDSGVLDAGLSQVSYGLISVQNSSITGQLLNIQIFTAASTVYIPATGTTNVVVEGLGGGGGGGGSTTTVAGQASAGGGGASGSYGRARFTSGFSGVTVTIGSGGAGGTAGGGSGGNGGTSSFGGLLICPGGLGGQGSAAIGSFPSFTSNSTPPGAAPTGANIYGEAGAGGGVAITLSAAQIMSGAGANSRMGAGGRSHVNASAAGLAATGFGAGGGGSAIGSTLAGLSGGAGSAGIVIVYEYS